MYSFPATYISKHNTAHVKCNNLLLYENNIVYLIFGIFYMWNQWFCKCFRHLEKSVWNLKQIVFDIFWKFHLVSKMKFTYTYLSNQFKSVFIAIRRRPFPYNCFSWPGNIVPEPLSPSDCLCPMHFTFLESFYPVLHWLSIKGVWY